MTLSSIASHGMPKGAGSEPAMPKGRWSDSSSEAGGGGKMTGLQKTLKGFAEPSEDSRSMDERDSMVDSSEGASMTSKGQTGARSRNARWKAGSSTGCMSGAINLVTKAMPKIVGNAGAEPSAASSSQGPRNILLPTQTTGGIQPTAAEESSESGNTVFYEDPSTQFHGWRRCRSRGRKGFT